MALDKMCARYDQKDLGKLTMYLCANIGGFRAFYKKVKKIIRKINRIHILKQMLLVGMCLSQVDCCAC